MTNYYLFDGQAQTGPFSMEDLKMKGITPGTHVWAEGFPEWQPAGEVTELKPLFAGMPPPFASPDAKHQPLFGPDTMEAAIKYIEDAKKKLSRWYGTIGGIAAGLLLLLIIWNSRQTSLILSSIKEEKDHKKEMRTHWADFLKAEGKVANDDYEISFTNNSDYLMNEMAVTVLYLDGSGKVTHTEATTAFNVPPHETYTQKVGRPYSYKDVVVKLDRVISAQAELRKDGNYDSQEPGDPLHMH